MNLPTLDTTADFLGESVRIIDINGQRWLTAEDVGHCLGYDEANARKGIAKLYERHADEFTENDTCVVNLATQGQSRAMRIFSAAGCVLLSMFSNTPRAKTFRAWAKQVLAVHPENPIAAHDPDRLQNTLDRMANSIDMLAKGMNATLLQNNTTAKYIGLLELNQQGHVRITRELERQVLELYAQGMPQKSIARLLRISAASVNLLVKGKYNFSPLAGTPCTPSEVSAAVVDRMISEERERVLRLAQSSAQS